MPGPLYISQYVKTHFHINILYVFKNDGSKIRGMVGDTKIKKMSKEGLRF